MLINERQEKNAHSLKYPTPGDYWHETRSAVCVVLAVSPFAITVCETKMDCDDDMWTWDLSETKNYTPKEFKKHLSYSSHTSILGTWADVTPKAHMWAVEEALEHVNAQNYISTKIIS